MFFLFFFISCYSVKMFCFAYVYVNIYFDMVLFFMSYTILSSLVFSLLLIPSSLSGSSYCSVLIFFVYWYLSHFYFFLFILLVVSFFIPLHVPNTALPFRSRLPLPSHCLSHTTSHSHRLPIISHTLPTARHTAIQVSRLGSAKPLLSDRNFSPNSALPFISFGSWLFRRK